MDNLHIFLGATVADAATRPLHWVYDPKKLKKYVKGKKEIVFLKKNRSPFYNIKTGKVSGYNDIGQVMLQTLISSKKKSEILRNFKKNIIKHFGPGSNYWKNLKPNKKDTFKFLYVSTDEIYGSLGANDNSFTEDSNYKPNSPYSATKAGAEELVVAYENTYGLPAIITHTMNVFGERQNPEKYIPMVIKKVRDGETVTVHANTEKTKAGSRHYIHAEDVANALLFLYKYDLSSLKIDSLGMNCQKFNIVGKDEIDNLSLAKFIAKVQDKKLNYEMVDFHSQRPGHDLRYSLDGQKMKKMGWEPNSAYDRLETVISWTLENDRWLKV